MEHALPELLTRQDLLRVLKNQRQLNIDEFELSDEELLKIFKSFAVPLARREKRINKQCSLPKQASASFAMEVDEPLETDTPLKMAFLNLLIEKKVINATEKRHLDCEDDDSLSSATKRIKITWP